MPSEKEAKTNNVHYGGDFESLFSFSKDNVSQVYLSGPYFFHTLLPAATGEAKKIEPSPIHFLTR